MPLGYATIQKSCISITCFKKNNVTTSGHGAKKADLVMAIEQSCHETFGPQTPHLIDSSHLNARSRLHPRNLPAGETQTQDVLQNHSQYYDHKDTA
jgi:hypothetical protein